LGDDAGHVHVVLEVAAHTAQIGDRRDVQLFQRARLAHQIRRDQRHHLMRSLRQAIFRLRGVGVMHGQSAAHPLPRHPVGGDHQNVLCERCDFSFRCAHCVRVHHAAAQLDHGRLAASIEVGEALGNSAVA